MGTEMTEIMRLQEQHEKVVDALYRVIGYALTSRSHSKEWLQGMADEINSAAELMGDPDRAVMVGDGLRVEKNKDAP